MKLSKEELQDLIASYQSELRVLSYRTRLVNEQLQTLRKAERVAKPSPAPQPSLVAGKTTGKRGRPPGSGSGGYRLNDWDELILKTLKGKKVGVFMDFFSAAKKIPAAKGLSQKDLYARINQSIHKLANKRGVLEKVKHEGRGFGYRMAQ